MVDGNFEQLRYCLCVVVIDHFEIECETGSMLRPIACTTGLCFFFLLLAGRSQ